MAEMELAGKTVEIEVGCLTGRDSVLLFGSSIPDTKLNGRWVCGHSEPDPLFAVETTYMMRPDAPGELFIATNLLLTLRDRGALVVAPEADGVSA